jgi:nucleotide-binding universal stress UspA family protein
MMFGTVIVPLDGSREAEQAIPYAWDEANRHGCTLVLIRVVPRPEVPALRGSHGGPASTGPLWAAAELVAAKDNVIAYLEDAVRRHGLPHDTELVIPVGDPFTRLQAEIERRPGPLVVLAADTETGSLTSALNETSRRLLLSGSAPVLRVRGLPRRPGVAVSPPVAPIYPRPALDDAAAGSWV